MGESSCASSSALAAASSTDCHFETTEPVNREQAKAESPCKIENAAITIEAGCKESPSEREIVMDTEPAESGKGTNSDTGERSVGDCDGVGDDMELEERGSGEAFGKKTTSMQGSEDDDRATTHDRTSKEEEKVHVTCTQKNQPAGLKAQHT